MIKFIAICGVGFLCACCTFSAEKAEVRKLHFIQDDAQDFMVSKIYHLKYAQGNDVMPFLNGIIKRYNMNSVASSIEYGNDRQLIAVTCPVKMMPYVDDFIAKVDQKIMIEGKVPGDIIRGSGITRAVYRPKYRSGQNILDVMVNAVLGAGPYSSVYAWDENSNQLYWKDNSSNVEYVYEFLEYLDRPAPQISFVFNIYEVRESSMRDLGVEYLAWKNGPGLNMFEVAFDAFSITSSGTAAITAASGPVGGFFFAPQFDASFIRLLAQSGNAKIQNSATITVSNSDTNSYSLYFNPSLQNIEKSDSDQTSVVASDLNLDTGYYQVYLKINQPMVNIHYGQPMSGYPSSEVFTVAPYSPGEYAKHAGTVFFGYEIQTANVVERNNLGSELVETNVIESNTLIELDKEIILGQWELDQKVEQTIGMPFLMDIPILGYLFSTTTTMTEKSKVYLSCTVRMLNTAKDTDIKVGEIIQIK